MKRISLAQLREALARNPEGLGLFFTTGLGHMVGCLREIENIESPLLSAASDLLRTAADKMLPPHDATDGILHINMLCTLEFVTINTPQGQGATYMPVVMPYFIEHCLTPKFQTLLGCTILEESADLTPEIAGLQSSYTQALLKFKAAKNGLKLP